jgi:RNA polymerase sigma-70 factor, ECF subfamily
MPPDDVTQLLNRMWDGDEAAAERAIATLYAELRAMAARALRAERDGHTLQPTALVHETFLRLTDQRAVAWQNRAQFLGVAGRVMRRVLVDHARRRHAAKRGGGAVVAMNGVPGGGPDRLLELLALDQALLRLQQLDERQARVVELRFFAGLEIDEAAEVLGVSPATVKRDWRFARAWLARALDGRDG